MLSPWIEDGCEPLCMERFYAGLSPDIEEATACVILETYCDDSETDELYIVAGYVAPLGDWKSFSPEWHRILKQPPRLGYYRTADALGRSRQFEHFDETTRDRRIADLARVIPNNPPYCFGVASWVSKSEFETYCHPVFHPAWHDPYYLCTTVLITRLCFDLSSSGLKKLDFFFDRQGNVGRKFKLIYDAFFKPTQVLSFPFLGDVHHKDKQEFLPLQAADMQAGWVRRTQSTIQVWTNADIFLRQINQKHYPIPQFFLEYIEKYGREHGEKIAAMWADYMKRQGIS
jgi:hypothetical protein